MIEDKQVKIKIPLLPPSATNNHKLGAGLHCCYKTISATCAKFDRLWVISYGATPYSIRPLPERIIVGLPIGKLPKSYVFYRPCQARYLRDLHAKVYLLFRGTNSVPSLAIVGSMNMVYSEMCECAVELDSQKQLRHLMNLFNGLWTIATPIQ